MHIILMFVISIIILFNFDSLHHTSLLLIFSCPLYFLNLYFEIVFVKKLTLSVYALTMHLIVQMDSNRLLYSTVLPAFVLTHFSKEQQKKKYTRLFSATNLRVIRFKWSQNEVFSSSNQFKLCC